MPRSHIFGSSFAQNADEDSGLENFECGEMGEMSGVMAGFSTLSVVNWRVVMCDWVSPLIGKQ
jgi:hypothetical protein